MSTFIHGNLYADLEEITDIIHELNILKTKSDPEDASLLTQTIDLLNDIIDNVE